ncbi:alpha/beta fold hydrolase [Cesiribacter andamanensis]|uniref:Acetoin dehydrogenase E2 subunit dihydrolipoyllysine-residue acetyltransferase n=1 Tax=Cesiribacter andamanensis AMV16 TaxID=1279009 RepID=M7N697_9BACT|nr:alpha/beta hydrolase [Cesiribacter andamanensis]EMR02787.1 acetoin dehydrogenase E2 subunit dihydrolipoyllysine-residue acetyltransferase [Cesiribacter andamanensis AMV16]
MTTGFFEFEGAKLHWWRWGMGPKSLLAFHGFGQHGQYFSPFARVLGSQYSVWSFDLFFHGQSVWPEPNQPLTPALWHRLIRAFLEQQGIGRFELAGYSMGGKFVLATLEAAAPQIDRMYLIAPDGIRTSFWYSMATYPIWARTFFRSLVDKPEPFYKLISGLERYKLMDKGILRFADWHMSNPDKRRKVYNSWTVFSPLRFNMRRIADLLVEQQIALEMYLGRYDRIMTPQGMQSLLRHLPHYRLEVLNTGHNGLIEAVARLIEEELRRGTRQQNYEQGGMKDQAFDEPKKGFGLRS